MWLAAATVVVIYGIDLSDWTGLTLRELVAVAMRVASALGAAQRTRLNSIFILCAACEVEDSSSLKPQETGPLD